MKHAGGLEAILFDFDGVLVDSEPLHFQCWNATLEPFGLSIEWDRYVKHCIGVSDKEMVFRLCELSGQSQAFDDVWRRYPHKKEMFRNRMAENIPMLEETRELLRSIRSLPLAVVSSSGRSEVEPPLVAAGVRDYFQTVVCGDDVQSLKPSPEPYLLAAKRLGVKRALVVEDSEAGIASGKAAGFEVVRVRSVATMAAQVRERLQL
jgi:beta-phosphoglucomutase